MQFLLCKFNILSLKQHFWWQKNLNNKNYIPVGCVPPARWPYLPVCCAPGVCSQGGVCSCGVSAQGGVPGGVSAPGGCLVRRGWYPNMHWGRPPCEQNYRRLWKYNLGPIFVAGGNKNHLKSFAMKGHSQSISKIALQWALLESCNVQLIFAKALFTRTVNATVFVSGTFDLFDATGM